jgi:NAD+ diphosphatase
VTELGAVTGQVATAAGVMRVPPLTSSTLDRAVHRRGDRDWLAAAWPRSRVLVVDRGKALVAGDRLVLIDPQAAPDGERLFLGVDPSDRPYFAVTASLSSVDHGEQGRAVGIREVGHRLPDFEAALMMTAVALANWHARHRYAPGSGLATTVRDGGWVRGDESGEDLWPRTDPAVIVLAHDGVSGMDGRCLLGHNSSWSRGGEPAELPRFSCLAGFVEPGESAEQAADREVREEVGVTIANLRYVGSQAWPYPGSLMLGFLARADPAQPLRLDPTEISAARWFDRTEIQLALGEDPAAGFALSPPSSIAHFLITTWLAGG